MGFNIISAAEAATYIKHGYNVGLSGFTPAGSPKAVTPEIAKIAEAEHAAGRSFQIGIFTGASTGDSADGALIRAKALRYRAPYTTNADFRKAVNNNEVAYNDIHLSQMAQELRYGYYGKLNVAIIEACHVTPDGYLPDCRWRYFAYYRPFGRLYHHRIECGSPWYGLYRFARRIRTDRPSLPSRNPCLQAKRSHWYPLFASGSEEDCGHRGSKHS